METTARSSTRMGLPITTLYVEGKSTTMKFARTVLLSGNVLAVMGSLIILLRVMPSSENP